MLNNNYSIKRRLLLSSYFYPFLMGMCVLGAKFSFWPTLNWLIVPATWGSILFVSLCIQKRYLSSFQLYSGKLVLTYLTPFLSEKTWEVDLQQVTGFQLEKAAFRGYTELHVITKGKWHSFDIADDKIAGDFRQALGAANIHLSEV